MNTLKIALVKSNIFQDLWISDITNDILTVFKTTLMRCSPIGITEKFDTDFFIIRHTDEYPTNLYTFIPSQESQISLKYSKENKIPGLPFLDESYHKNTSIDEVSYDVDNIDWSQYQIIIAYNACIPDRIIHKYSNSLWCYYLSENEECFLNGLFGNYDLLLNQNMIEPTSFSIGFPYTFLGPYTLKNMYMKYISSETFVKKGMFIEINNIQQRPVPRELDIFENVSIQCNIPYFIHQQNIVENLTRLVHSRYFIKLYGRTIRGNGVLEAISCGTLVLINKHLLIYTDLIPDECHIETVDDLISKIKFFESNEDIYESMVKEQRCRLEQKYFLNPLNQLYDKYLIKNKLK